MADIALCAFEHLITEQYASYSSASISSKRGATFTNGRSPASVVETLRGVRVSSRRPSLVSSARMVWLNADWDTPSCAAALVKLRSRATASKAMSSFTCRAPFIARRRDRAVPTRLPRIPSWRRYREPGGRELGALVDLRQHRYDDREVEHDHRVAHEVNPNPSSRETWTEGLRSRDCSNRRMESAYCPGHLFRADAQR